MTKLKYYPFLKLKLHSSYTVQTQANPNNVETLGNCHQMIKEANLLKQMAIGHINLREARKPKPQSQALKKKKMRTNLEGGKGWWTAYPDAHRGYGSPLETAQDIWYHN